MRIGRSNKNQTSDAGFSLVELVIVIAIMAIVVGTLSLSVSVLTGRRVRKCADEIATALERARVLTLGKAQNDVECTLSVSADGDYTVIITQGGTEVLNRVVGESPITVTVYFDNETTGYSLGDIAGSGESGTDTGAGLHFVYNRSSGAFVENTNSAGGAKKKYCTKIVVANGTREASIGLVGQTGKLTTD